MFPYIFPFCVVSDLERREEALTWNWCGEYTVNPRDWHPWLCLWKVKAPEDHSSCRRGNPCLWNEWHIVHGSVGRDVCKILFKHWLKGTVLKWSRITTFSVSSGFNLFLFTPANISGLQLLSIFSPKCYPKHKLRFSKLLKISRNYVPKTLSWFWNAWSLKLLYLSNFKVKLVNISKQMLPLSILKSRETFCLISVSVRSGSFAVLEFGTLCFYLTQYKGNFYYTYSFVNVEIL